MQVEVIRSPRRKRTVSARMVEGKMQLQIPARMTKAEEQHWIEVMGRRLERDRKAGKVDIEARAAQLADRYGMPRPTSIRWVDNQVHRWGSCTPADGTIRISTAVSEFPAWVIDYVVVHELAHLMVPGHGAGFWLLVGRYPRTERARGFLMAKGGE